MMDHDTATPGTYCPRCAYYVDRAASIGSTAVPEPGDFSLCLNCGALNRFKQDMLLEPVPDDDPDLLDLTPQSRLKIMLVQGYIAKRGPIKKDDPLPS